MEFQFRVDEDYLAEQTIRCLDVKKEENRGISNESYAETPKKFFEVYRAGGIYVAKQSTSFEKLVSETEEYVDQLSEEWQQKRDRIEAEMDDITRLNRTNERFTVYVTHPSLCNGSYWNDFKIKWGHAEDWPNYSMVYLQHEALHEHIIGDLLPHSIVELATDEELRVRLNGGDYPPFFGKKERNEMKTKLLPFWKEYLENKNINILEFWKLMELKHPEKS